MRRRRTLTAAVVACAALVCALTGLGLALAAGDPTAQPDKVATDVTFVAAFAVVGLLIAFRQPRNALGWMMYGGALSFVLNATGSEYSIAVYRQHRAWRPLGSVAVFLQPGWAPAIVLGVLAILMFPDGRLPLGRWRWGVWAFLGIAALWMFGAFGIAANAIANHDIHITQGGDLTVIDKPAGANAWWGWTQDVFFLSAAVALLLAIARQVRAYRRATGERRLQVKWLLWGAAIFAASGPFTLALGSQPKGWENVASALAELGLVAIPVCMGVALLKYRLFDIDRVISRTLSYAVLTAVLAGFYLLVVFIVTQAVPVSGSVAVAVSTLAVASMFNPLRKRTQRLVDRRFNRAKYDAEAIIGRFSAALRDAVSLDRVQGELMLAARECVQPSQLSVWVRPTP